MRYMDRVSLNTIIVRHFMTIPRTPHRGIFNAEVKGILECIDLRFKFIILIIN